MAPRDVAAAAGLMLLALVSAAWADDGAAALAAGGVVFTKQTDVRMASEDLYISPKIVRVRFEFVNDSSKNLQSVVAFPLPEIDLPYEFASMSAPHLPHVDLVNFVGFSVRVDGKAAPFQTQQRAILANRDVTDLVASSNSRKDVAEIGYEAMNGQLPKAELTRLEQAGLLIQSGAGNEIEYGPRWRVRTSFYWTQEFPAHRRVVIEHSYEPVLGSWNTPDGPLSDKRFRARFCIGTVGTLLPPFFPSTAEEADYVLVTAKTWKGPIGRFHLTLDKLSVWSSLWSCWDDDLHRTGLSTYELTRANFVPTRDIQMLVLQ